MFIKKGRHLISDGKEIKEVTINKVTETCFKVNGQWVKQQDFLSKFQIIERIPRFRL
jgi:hypothetical protein